MRGACIRAVVGVWVVALSLASPALAADRAEANEIHRLTRDWQTAEARERLTPLLAAEPSDPILLFAHGRLLFFEGRYAEAHDVLVGLVQLLGDDAPAQMRLLLADVRATRDALQDFDEFATPDGRFLVRFKGVDRVVIPYLVEVLQRADVALAADFGWKPRGRVLVEVYPEISYLAKVSPLTEEDIETSGTIALCKYNRLMFTSPRALVRGYGWRDTVAHEFVHYYVTKLSSNTVPIWLHEGIAKFEETRWRAVPGLGLDPPQEDLLARSLKADKLITFDQMHPSMAKLPSQEAAGLAFAQVHTVVAWLHEQKGYDALRGLLRELRGGAEMDGALKSTYGYDLGGLWTRWKAALRTKGLREFPGLVQTSLQFKRPGDGDGEPEADYGSIEEKKVKDHTHLGELLRARERHKAAWKEYQRAMALGGEGNPVIQNGAASSLIALEREADVPALLSTVVRYYPGFLPTHINLGEAFLALGRDAEAVAAFEEAVGINPFHPRPHAALVELYPKVGRDDDVARAKKALEILR